MNWKTVETMPERPIMEHGKEVLCYGHGEFLVGYLYHKYGKVTCEADDTMLEGVTHWCELIEPNDTINSICECGKTIDNNDRQHGMCHKCKKDISQ